MPRRSAFALRLTGARGAGRAVGEDFEAAAGAGAGRRVFEVVQLIGEMPDAEEGGETEQESTFPGDGKEQPGCFPIPSARLVEEAKANEEDDHSDPEETDAPADVVEH